MKRFLEVGRVTKTQGLKGEVRMQLYCEHELLEELETLYIGKEKTPVRLLSCRYLKNNVSVILPEGADSPETAQKFLGKTLYLDREDVELPENVWFIDDLIGLSVVDADSGKVYGKVDEILQNGGADVYSLRTPQGRQYLFPAVPEVLLETDIEGGKIVIRPPNGLFDIYETGDGK